MWYVVLEHCGILYEIIVVYCVGASWYIVWEHCGIRTLIREVLGSSLAFASSLGQVFLPKFVVFHPVVKRAPCNAPNCVIITGPAGR